MPDLNLSVVRWNTVLISICYMALMFGVISDMDLEYFVKRI